MMEEEAAAPPQDHLVAMDVDGGIVGVESCDAKDHQGSSMYGSFQQEEEEGRSGPVTSAAADPETSTFPSSVTQETKKTLSTATPCGRGGAGGGEEAGEDYEASGSRDDGQLLEVFNNTKKQRKRSSDCLAASDSTSLGGGGGGGGGGLDGEAAAASHHHVCRQCKRKFSSGRALGGHMRAHGSLAMEDGNARVTWNNSSETVVAAAVASDKELQQQLTSSSSWRARGTSYLVNPASDLDSCRDESSPSLASSRPLRLGTHSCSRSEEAGRVRKRGRVSSSAADAAAELVGRCQEPEEDQDHEEEEATSVLLGSSSSSEATGNSKMQQAEEFDVTEGTSYMCQICEEEFETARDLKLHKKEHPQYILRMNPKRSQRFLDQDSSDLLLAATAAATGQSTHHHQPKKAALSSGMGTTEESKLPISCTECEKKFGSMKALFGHMRCHPEREWRGIQPPDRSTAAAGHAANHGSSRKKRRPPPPVVPLPTADPESESETETDSKPPPAAAGKLGSDLDSDTESIEAAYINGSSRQSSGPPGWRTKKRTKRTKQTVRSLQAVVTGGGGGGGAAAAAAPEEEEEEEPGPSSSSTPTETQVHKDIVFALMLLRPKRVAQLSHPPSLEQEQCKQEGSRSMNMAEKFKAPNVDNYKSTDCHDTHKQHQQQQYHRDPDDSKGKRNVEDAAEDASLISDGQDFDEMETGEQGGGVRMMYQCATCKRIFKSHQALGGHRASHKKVKGCFARTSVNDEEGFGRQQDQSREDNNKEDIPDENFLKAEEQLLLPHEPQEPSHHSEEDAELPCDYLTVARGDNEEMLNAVRKSKGHECSICHRIFNSGQALGGHKRCHWGGGTGTAGPNEATTTVHNLNNNNAVVMVNGDQPGLQESHPIQGLPVPGGQQNKGMQEGIIDLNMPAPECVEEIVEEQIASASASGMAPPIDHHHPSYLPFPTFTTDSPAFIIQQPCSDLVEKCTKQQHIKFLGESMDTKVDKSLEPIASNGATDAGGDFRTGDDADQAMDPGMKGADAGGDFRTGDAADQAMDRGMKGTDAVGDFRSGNVTDQAMDQGMKGTDAVGDFRSGDAADQAMDRGMKGTDAVGDFRSGDAADQAMDREMKGTDAVEDFRSGDAADQAMDPGVKSTDAVEDFRSGDAADQAMDPGVKSTDAVEDFRSGDAADQATDPGVKGTDAVGDFRSGDAAYQAMDWGMKGKDAVGDLRSEDAADQARDPGMKGTDAVGDFRSGDAADQAMDQGMKGTDAVGNFRSGDAAVQIMDQGMKGTELQHMKSCWGDSLDTKVDTSLEPITSVGATDAVGFRTGDADVMDRGMNNFSNTCDQGFTSLEHLSNHQNTHAAIMGPAPSLTA